MRARNGTETGEYAMEHKPLYIVVNRDGVTFYAGRTASGGLRSTTVRARAAQLREQVARKVAHDLSFDARYDTGAWTVDVLPL